MFKWVLVAAFLLSVLACAGWDLYARRQLEERRFVIALKRIDLHKLRDFDREVQIYQERKDALQVRIDAINHLKQNQKTAADAVAKLGSVDPASIESAAVIDGKQLLINTPSGRIVR